MPNIMIHEKVGDYIGKQLNINSYDYYLGLMAPDAPNLEGFAPKEERWMAHQRRKDYDEWRKSIISFYQKEKENYPKDFLLGYYIHVLTDIVYDDYFYLEVRKEILKNYSLEESHQIMREDMNKYYFDEINTIKRILQEKEDSYNILNISKSLLIKWKEKEISTWINHNTSKYITEDVIHSLQVKVYEEVLKTIEK